ncbi:hypothetical protein P4S72_04240 [Vibrio sp. PP-XX7]
MANPYREMLTTPRVMGLVFASFIVRMPQAMIGIGIITMLAEQRGLYWLAGSVAATFTLANALIGPRRVKFVDRHGQSRVSTGYYRIQHCHAAGAADGCLYDRITPAPFILAALAGTMPNMPAMIRARWTELFRRQAAITHGLFPRYRFLTELSYIVGPVLAIALSTKRLCRSRPPRCRLAADYWHDSLSFAKKRRSRRWSTAARRAVVQSCASPAFVSSFWRFWRWA